jgi:hypothetical protein
MARQLTANEWVQELQRRLGGGDIAASVPTSRADGQAAGTATEPIGYDSRTFDLIDATERIIQIIPRGYYDTILVSYMTLASGQRTSRPINIHPGSIAGSEGVYLRSNFAASSLLFQFKYPPLWVEHPRADVNESSATNMIPPTGLSVRFESDLTNMPFFLSFADVNNPVTAVQIQVRVTLMTIRHQGGDKSG